MMEFSLKFQSIVKICFNLVFDFGDGISKFVSGGSETRVNECRTTMLIKKVF